MNSKMHNKIEITSGTRTVCFYNTMLKSVLQKYNSGQSFFDYLAIGTGSGTHQSDNYKLLTHLKNYKLETEYLQDDVSSGGDLFVKKSVIIDDETLNGTLITEAGITDTNGENPTIYNYFKFEEDGQEIAIEKQAGVPILISVYLYLSLSAEGEGLLTAGKNKFVDFLLGFGLEDKIYASRGQCLKGNSSFVQKPNILSEKVECEFSAGEVLDGYEMTFSADLDVGETSEIVFSVGDVPFARLSVLEKKTPTSESETVTPKTNYVIDMGEDVKEITSITNANTSQVETNTYQMKYAGKFGERVFLPFDNLFSNSTPRFLSKDGKKIFFNSGDKIFGYENDGGVVQKIDTSIISLQNITHIIALDDFVFVVTKSEPYISAYKISDGLISQCEIDLDSFEYNNLLADIYKIDICLSRNDKLMIGFIGGANHYGYALYFDYDSEDDEFSFDAYYESSFSFHYVLAMQKNNFTDSMLIFLKGADWIYDTKIVYFFADKTMEDAFTPLANHYTENAREIYTKNRAVIIEKTTTPRIWIYYYPQIYRYTLSLFGDEENDYISSNLLYLIQKMSSTNYKIYNLVGYDSPTEFEGGFPSEIELSKVQDFEFLDNILLIFMDSKTEPIVAYGLFENSMLIENVSSKTDSYQVSYKKYDLIGKNNEGVIVDFTIKITI